jgi:hypothetical protein
MQDADESAVAQPVNFGELLYPSFNFLVLNFAENVPQLDQQLFTVFG